MSERIKTGDYIRFMYREQGRTPGSAQFNIHEYSGVVERVYKNGQFLLANNSGLSMSRFETVAITEYL